MIVPAGIIIRASYFCNLKGERMCVADITQKSLDGLKLSKEEINSVAPCGLICGLCKKINEGCRGCRYGGGDQNCYQLNCCKGKGIAGCWECESFPCSNGYLFDEKWKGVIIGFAKCIRVVGPEKFYKKVKSTLGSSINYDEYACISEQNIIRMFYD